MNIHFEAKHTHTKEKIKFRDMSLTNKQRFHDMLNNTDCVRELQGILSTNDQVSILLAIISNYCNHCFPIKIETIGPNRLNKPWMTDALLMSINTKHNLYKLVKQNRFDREFYKRYANTLTNLILQTAV